jgi:hypothetical protein
MITAIPDWLFLTCAIVGAWFLISVIIITPFIILSAVTRRHDRRVADAVIAEMEAELKRAQP